MNNLDQINTKILVKRKRKFNSHAGPRVGDFVKMLDGTLQRFCHDWGDEIQTTDGKFGASFHLYKSGCSDFSGGLNPAIPKTKLEQTEEIEYGSFWFFSHDEVKAHNGIYVKIPCRVFKQLA